jgi:hypothetical protein
MTIVAVMPLLLKYGIDTVRNPKEFAHHDCPKKTLPTAITTAV